MADESRKDDRAVTPGKTPGTPRETPDTDARQTDTDRERAEHARRRRDEPAAAALETDAEAGAGVTPSGAAPHPGRPDQGAPPDPVPAAKQEARRENEREYAPDRDPPRHEVRAGPGDAGASDRPTPLPQNPESAKRRPARKTMALIVVGALALLIVLALL